MADAAHIPVNVTIWHIGRLALIRSAVPKHLAKGVRPLWTIGILKKETE